MAEPTDSPRFSSLDSAARLKEPMAPVSSSGRTRCDHGPVAPIHRLAEPRDSQMPTLGDPPASGAKRPAVRVPIGRGIVVGDADHQIGGGGCSYSQDSKRGENASDKSPCDRGPAPSRIERGLATRGSAVAVGPADASGAGQPESKRVTDSAQSRRRPASTFDGRLPACVPDSVRADLAQMAVLLPDLPKGHVLAHTGARFRQLFLVLRGAFKATQLGEDGQSQIVGFRRPGEFMGLGGFAEHRYAHDLVALGPSQVCEFPVAGVEALAQRSPHLFDCLLEHLARRLVDAERDQFMLGSMSGTQKMAYFLLRARERGLSAPDGCSVELPMSRKDLGSYLGMTKESVIRVLSLMRRSAMVDIGRQQVRILDEQALRAWLDGEPEAFPQSRRGRT